MVSYNKTLIVAFLTSLINAAPVYPDPANPLAAPDAGNILDDMTGKLGGDSYYNEGNSEGPTNDVTGGAASGLGSASGALSGILGGIQGAKRDTTSGVTGSLGGAGGSGALSGVTGALGGASGGANGLTGALSGATGAASGGASGVSGASNALSSGASAVSGAAGSVSSGASAVSGASDALSSGASAVSGATGSGNPADALTGILSGLTGGASGSTGVLNTITGLFGDKASSALGGSDPLSCVVKTLVGDVSQPSIALQALQVVLATGIDGYKKNGTFEALEGMILSMDAANGGNGGFAPLALAQLGVAFASTANDGQKGLEIFGKYLKTLIQVTQNDLNTLPQPGPSATNNYFYNKMTSQAQQNGIILGFFQDETLEAADILIKDYNWICVSANGILQSAESLVNCVGGLESLSAPDNALKDFVGLWCPTNSDYINQWGTGTSTISTSLQSVAV